MTVPHRVTLGRGKRVCSNVCTGREGAEIRYTVHWKVILFYHKMLEEETLATLYFDNFPITNYKRKYIRYFQKVGLFYSKI